MRVALIGYNGYWGQKLARVLKDCGIKIEQWLDRTNSDELGRVRVDAAVIATPPDTHFKLGMQALEHGLDVLIEKPMTLKHDQARRLVDKAHDMDCVLSVDSTFCHTAAMEFLLNLDEPVISYQSLRMAPPMPQATIPAGWDLIVHDLSILDVLGSIDFNTEGIGAQDGSVAQCAFHLSTGGSAFIMSSRMWPCKERSITIHFPSGAFYWTLGSLQTFKPDSMSSEIVVNEKEEPLKRLIKDFEQRCLRRDLAGITDGLHGARVVNVLERMFPDAALGHSGERGVRRRLPNQLTV